MKQYSTLKKLSEQLGLSVSTVSRALKDHPDISAATRKRVKELAELSEYEPNNFAQNLKSNKSMLLGVIVPCFQNLFFEYVIAAVEEEASQLGYSLLVLQSGECAEKELKNLAIMKKNRVDGLFVSITEKTKDIAPFFKLSEIGIPLIFFDRVPQVEACNKICFADADAAVLAAHRIIKSDKKNILCLFCNPNLSITQRRLAAFKETFKNLAPDIKLDIRFHSSAEEAETVTAKALEEESLPDAMFCMGDNTMLFAMKAITKRGLKVPEDLGMIFISHGFIPALYNPPMTYVETNGSKLGKLAFSRLTEIFAGKTFLRELFVDAVLVEGGSL